MFHASREATLRRYAETSSESLAIVYFGWKLKPTQERTIGNRDQRNLFSGTSDDARREALKLRIEYTVPSEAFRSDGHYLPKDKSVESDGPIYRAAASGEPMDDECRLDLGQASGTYRVSAVPLWTAEANLGAAGECSVAAVLRPIAVHRPPKKRRAQEGPGLFGEA